MAAFSLLVTSYARTASYGADAPSIPLPLEATSRRMASL
jgi:hypothetical protein